MRGDLKDEDAVASRVDELVCWRPAKRKSAEYKWPRMKGNLLLMILPLVADEVNAVEVFKAVLRDADVRCIKAKAVSDGRKTVALWWSC